MSRAYGDLAPRWRRYLRLWGRDLDADVDDELRFHVEMREQEYLAAGMTPEKARAEAMTRFGDVARVRESCAEISHRRERRMHFTEWLATVRQDSEYAVRQLARSPSFAIAAVLTLALGIGANSAIFSLVDAVLLRPLPGIREPERLVEMTSFSVSYPAFRDFRETAREAVDLAGFRERPMALGVAGATAVKIGGIVSGNYFSVLGAAASHGRTLTDADDRPGAPVRAVISHSLWTRSFDGDPAVLGRTIQVNGASVAIVGVMERGFRGTRMVGVPDFWVPINAWPQIRPSSFQRLGLETRSWSWISAVGRLRPGMTEIQAEAVLSAAARRQRELHPTETRENTDVSLSPSSATALGRGVGEVAGQVLSMLAAVVSIVLLISCANIANLLLARAARRRREIGVRLALGASRARLVRQLVTESMVLAMVAGATGLAAAWLVLRLLGGVTLGGIMSFAPLDLRIDGRIAAFALGVSVVTGLIFGLLPALEGSRLDTTAVLKDGSAGAGRRRSRLRDSLLVAQVALSLVLLVGAGLFLRGLQRALATDIGFNTNGVALASVDPSLVKYDTARAWQYYTQSAERLGALPGVRSVTSALTIPLTLDQNSRTAALEGYVARNGESPELNFNIVGRDFFRTLQIPLAAGRAFDATDTRTSRKVAIVNEALVARYWPGLNAVGKWVAMAGDTLRIIGVTRNAKYYTLAESPAPHIYTLVDQQPSVWNSPMTLFVRMEGDVEPMLASIRSTLRAVGPDVPVVALSGYGRQFDAVLAPQRIAATLLGFFGLLALVVASVGVYGVVAYSLSQRTREIGIRMALGAHSASVLGMVMRESLRRVAVGIAIGAVLALAGTRILESLLYGVSATDPLTFGAMSLLLLAVAAVASLLPARRATEIDPLTALRAE